MLRSIPDMSNLWFAGLSGIGRVQLLEHVLVLGLDGLLLVDVVDLRLPTAKHQDHWARLDAYRGVKEEGKGLSCCHLL